MRSNTGKATRSRTQHKSASSSTKSKRSTVISKTGNSESAGDRVLEPGISEDTSGEDLSTESVELTAITLHQPWASLVAKGWKQYETRDWPTNHRGLIVIHAGRKPKGKQELREHDKVVASFKDLLNEDCPYSAVVAIAQLTDVILMTDEFIGQQTETELRCGNWAVGRYAFKLENVRAIEPIPAVGKQGLWKWKIDAENVKSDECIEEELEKGSKLIALRRRFLELFFIHKDASGISKSDELEPWNPADFGELHHVAEADGQLNLLDWSDKEPPEPDDYSSIELFDEAYQQWVDAQTDEAEEELANFGVEELKSNQFKAGLQTEEGKTKAAEFGVTIEPPDPNDYEFPEQFEGDYKNWVAAQPDENLANFKEVETWNQLMDGLICVPESEPVSPTPESNCGEEAPTSSVNGMNTVCQSSDNDSLIVSDLPISNSLTLPAKSPSPIDQESSQLPPPASPLAMMGSDSQQTTTETASPTCSEQSENCNPNSQLLKTLPDSLIALTPPATNQEPISDLSSTPYPRAGTMQNGLLSAAPILPPPGVESESLLLRAPGGLSSTGETRPPGKTRLETQLNQLGLIQDGEVAAPEFLELGYNLPVGWTNLQENRTALELAQQSSLDHKSESPQGMAITASEGKPSETHSTGELQALGLSELNISVTLPPNIGALTKNELISMAQEQHQLICVIERKEFELAIEKLHRVRLTGVYLQEFKKKCQYGEFENQLEQAGIGIRSAQNYMAIAKNWDIVEAKTKLVALLAEENQPAIGLKWALEAVRDEKKQLKSAAPPKDPNNWKTPENKEQPIVSLVKKALGGQIYLDPCSDSGCNIPATMRYFKWSDGLASHNVWQKTVFINPPFSDPFPWVERTCLEIARGSVSAAVMLLKAGVISNIGTGDLINKYASAICHWRGRINFLNDEGNAVKGSDFDCVFVYFGARLDLFRGAFGGRGTIATIENHYSSVNKKYMTPNEKSEFGNVEEEQKQLAAAVGLGNGRAVFPDMRDADRALAEKYDPHTVVDVFSMPAPATPATPISGNLFQSIAEPEIFDETPLATRQLETAKQNTLNDYITAISSNLSDFSDEQIAFLVKIVNEESVKRIGF